jgi:hypothetical protein
VPGIETSSSGSGFSAQGIAGNFLAQEFTQNLLQPLGSNLGQALGLQNLALGYNFGSGVSAAARKQLGKNLYATVSQIFGGTQRQALTFNYDLPRNTSLALTGFSSGTQTLSVLNTTQFFAPTQPINFTLQSLAPPPGASGVVFTYQRKFR